MSWNSVKVVKGCSKCLKNYFRSVIIVIWRRPMKKIMLFLSFYVVSLAISVLGAEFKWNHNYQEKSSKDLTTLSNKLCGISSTKSFQTEGFSLIRPAFSLKCGGGTIFYEYDEEGILRGFYYEGNATISFEVNEKVEAEHLEKAIKKNKLASEPINAFYVLLLGKCSDLPELVSESKEITQNSKMGSLKSGFRRDAIKFLNCILNPQNFQDNDLVVLFELNKEIWAYQLNSTLENEVQLLRLSHPPYSDYDMWDPVVSLHLISNGSLTPYISDAEYRSKVFCDLKKYELFYDLNQNGTLNGGVVKVNLFLSKIQNSLVFDFYPGFKVNKVSLGDRECQFIKEDFSRTYSYYDTSLLVKFPEKAEGNITLTFDISGDLFDKTVGYIYPVEEDLWFPLIKDLDGFLWSFSATVPEGVEVLAVGNLIKDYTESGKTTFLWESSTPIRNATFTMGVFVHKKVDLEDGVSLDVALPKDLRTNILSQAQEYTLNELKNIFMFYSGIFGKSPYKNLKVVITPYSFGRSFKWRGFSTEKMKKREENGDKDMPVAGSRHLTMQERKVPASLQLSSYGRGFPTLIMLTENALYRSGDSQPEKLLAHQVALNWWDSVVSPLTERDIWLSAGMAEFSSLLYLQGRFGEGTVRIFRENMLTGGSLAKRGNLDATVDVDEYPSDTFFSKVESFSSSGESSIPFDDGPICLGTRTYSTISSQPLKSYESIVYTKGAFIFGMLYNLSRFTNEKEEGFFKGLKNILTKYNGQRISTGTFFRELESSMKIPLSSFLRSWYESTGIPKVEVKTSIISKDGNYIVIAEGKCDKDLFFGVPLRIILSDKKSADYILLFQNKTAKSEWKFVEKPKKVDVDSGRVVFCDYGKVK